MKYICIFTIILLNISLYSQSIELSGGITVNKFYDWEDNYHNYNGKYSSGLNSYFEIGLRQFQLDDAQIGITITYEKYGGNISAYSGGMGGGSRTTAKINKSLFSFGLFPIDRQVFGNFNLSLGLIFSTLLNEKFSGTYRVHSNFSSSLSQNENLQEKYERFNSKSYLGVKGGISYDIKLLERIEISPQYFFYLGISSEIGVSEFQRDLRSMRHYIGLGIKRKLK